MYPEARSGTIQIIRFPFDSTTMTRGSKDPLSPKKSAIVVRTTIGVERDLVLLQPFISHYRNLGVDTFRIILHARSKTNPELKRAFSILETNGISPAKVWITENWNTGENALMHKKVVHDLPSDTWIVSTDIDEFHEYPKNLPEFVSQLESEKIDVVKGRLIERIARNFCLISPNPNLSLFEQYPIELPLQIGNSGKIMLHRKFIYTAPGHHDFLPVRDNRTLVYPEILKVMHFKWFEDVRLKYTDPAFMAHHSYDWEFSEYDCFILRNFFGWRRLWNRFYFAPSMSWLRNSLKFSRRQLGELLRTLCRLRTS